MVRWQERQRERTRRLHGAEGSECTAGESSEPHGQPNDGRVDPEQ